jgi:hypothetical protein
MQNKFMEEFKVKSLEGNYAHGHPEDYLVRGIEGELYICNKDIFEKTYEWIKEEEKDEGS